MTALAQVILEQKGIVYGACLDTADWLVKYTGIEVENDLHQIRRSKYVQSDTGHSYYRIKQWLEAGRYVLFVGCPCQVAGLYACIGNDYKNLFTVDLLCHGVPSPRLFQEHVSYLEKKYKRKLVDFYFRDKMKFSNKIALRYIFRNKSVNILGKCEPYFKSFINGTAYRMCCYQCQYAQKQRVGDITLGDYWGIRKMHPEFDSTFGASLILVNTEKGKKLLSAANLKLKESDIEKAAAGNGILDRPSEMASCRKDFYQDIVKNGYLTTVRKNVKTLPAIYNGILSFLPREIIEKLSRIK